MKNIQTTCLLIIATCSVFLLFSCGNGNSTAIMTEMEQLAANRKMVESMQSAYEGEKTATAKYAAFSEKAEEEGLHGIALLYKAASAAENIHARNHKAVIEDAGKSVSEVKPEYTVKTTKENLFNDINGETSEAITRYPAFLKVAEIAGNQTACLSLSYAMRTQQKHKSFFEKVLDDINSSALNSLPPAYYVCPACGNTYAKAPKHCDFSLTCREEFLKFE